ncbi:hypothetical protein TNCV_1439191 [Trichonephila clavipes]|nr:hypothetical protein TNCV_1439191 [Trichonephila clavipes]
MIRCDLARLYGGASTVTSENDASWCGCVCGGAVLGSRTSSLKSVASEPSSSKFLEAAHARCFIYEPSGISPTKRECLQSEDYHPYVAT